MMLVFILTSCTAAVSAADPWDGLVETSVLKSVTDTSGRTDSNGKFDGYIQSVEDTELLAGDYIKVTYTVTGTVDADTKIFNIQPYNTAWSGWNNNYITIGSSTLENGVYTAYVSIADVKNSLSDGTLRGINISFMPNSGYEAEITGYYYLAPEPEEMTDRKRLKMSIDYCRALDPAKYQPASWQTFLTAVETAESVYGGSATNAQLQTARANLEKAKANLLFADSTGQSEPMDFRVLGGDETVYEMGVGWNLGNTMDGHTGFHPSETAWQSVVTTKEIIKSVHDAGFNTVRIPVTWGDMIDDRNGYAINDAWLSRVQDIVDYCTELDMYAIINIHHDGAEQTGWLRVAADDIDSVYEKFECVWRNIAERFKDYDEHLIFESANELTCMEGDDKNSSEAIAKDTPVIMNLNQIFVNTVRSTGSNNTRRWLAVVSHYANGGTQSGFSLPSDSYNSDNRIMFASHIYKHSTKTTWTYDQVYEVVDNIKKMLNKHDVPIILGEYGNRNYKNTANPSGFNDLDRAWFDEIVVRACQVGGVVPCVWDQGWFDLSEDSDKTYAVWDREGKKPIFKTITDAMMRGMYLLPSSKNQKYDLTDIVRNPSITEISQIVPNTESITMQYGDVYNISVSIQPNSTNDVVLWKSADDSVATVSRGIVQGNKIGTTVITAFSQSGSASTEIKVTVLPRQTDIPAESITLDSAGYEVLKGKYVNIDAAIEPVNSTDSLIYSSSNEEVATVNRQGKIVGVSAGTAYITVMASSGITETVPVTVTEASGENKLSLAANVYYNDPGYNGNETGEPITVTGDGQYTLSFDVNSDLSDRAKDAGIEFLKNLTSIYIKDNDVTMGSAVRSPLDGCLIRYDSVKVNGTPLTLTNSEFKSAIKDSGIFDTNDPINGWDGSAVEEVTTSDHTVNFTTVEDPAKIEITFTLKDLKFSEEVSAGDIPAEAIVPEAGVDITLTEGQELNLGVKLTPDNTTSLVSFTSSDMGVVMVDDSAAAVDENGCAYACLKGVSSGSAVITAMTDNGLKAVLNVTVGVYPFSSVVPVVENGVLSSVTAVAEYIPSGEFAVIAAVYDSGGAVKACESMQLDASAVSNGILNADGFSLNVGEGDTVKAFIWSSTGDMIPMSK